MVREQIKHLFLSRFVSKIRNLVSGCVNNPTLSCKRTR